MIKMAMVCQQVGQREFLWWWVTDQEVESYIKQYTGGLLHSRMIDQEPMISKPIRIKAIIVNKWPITNVNMYMYSLLFIPAYRKHQHRDYIHKTVQIVYAATKQTTSTFYNY